MSFSKNKKIGVLCGGISAEREVSLRSGKNCFEALHRLGYKNSSLIDIQSIDDIVKNKIEVAFLTTHGKFGEDGAIQGILEWLQIPYTGSSILASAISMDKLITKSIAKSLGLNVANAELVTESNFKTLDTEKIWKSLSNNGAVFLKPKNDGSSVSTYKIKSLNELNEKLSLIDLKKSDFMLEEFIPGREITMSLLASKTNPCELKVLPALELRPKNEFYDYEAKYTKGMTEFILPAQISKETNDELNRSALKLFTAIGCSGFGRVDFILNNETPYVLEVNSLPGMTDTSDLPAQAKEAGISYDEVVDIVLNSARLHI